MKKGVAFGVLEHDVAQLLGQRAAQEPRRACERRPPRKRFQLEERPTHTSAPAGTLFQQLGRAVRGAATVRGRRERGARAGRAAVPPPSADPRSTSRAAVHLRAPPRTPPTCPGSGRGLWGDAGRARCRDQERQPEDLSPSETLEHHLRRIRLDDAEVLLERLGQWPVRDGAAIGEAAPHAELGVRRLVPRRS